MTTDQENAADASEFRREYERDQEAAAQAGRSAMSKRLHSQLAALPPEGGRVRDPETKYVYRAERQYRDPATSHPFGQFEPSWLLHPVCRERYVDGDCPFPVHALGLCELHYSRYRHQAAGQLDCAMDAPKREFPDGPMQRMALRLPLELLLRCNVAAGRAGLERNVSEWMRRALEAACALSESMADPKRNPQFVEPTCRPSE